MKKSSLHFKLLGTSFSIAADEDNVYLESLLSKYKSVLENTQKATGVNDPLKLAILTGFLLCDEINKLKQQAEEDQSNADAQRADEEHELDRIAKNLIACIDQAIEETDPLDD